MDKKTPLYEEHLKANGRVIPYTGFLLPVQYESGVKAEHMAVRTAAGLFDVSHMGEVVLKGPDAVKNLNHLLTNDYTKMSLGKARYSPMCNESGGTVDDLIVYKKAEDEYLIVVNSENQEKDYNWMVEHSIGDVTWQNISDDIGQVALQGPKSKEILAKLTPEELIPVKYYSAIFASKVGEIDCMVSRTGYTGEFGYEIYCKAEDTPKVWQMLLEAGKEYGLIPCGLGARDTLRLEAGMPLYTHEMNDEISPLETGLGFAVKMDKEDFIGKKALEERVLDKERVGMVVTGRGILREEMEVFKGEEEIGVTTSGTYAPFIGKGIAMALVKKGSVNVGDTVEVNVRGRNVEAEIVELPFYVPKK